MLSYIAACNRYSLHIVSSFRISAVQPSPVNALPVTLMVWTMWLGRLFHLPIHASLTGELVCISVHTVCSIWLPLHHCEVKMWMSHFHFSTCANDGTRTCSVSWLYPMCSSFTSPCAAGGACATKRKLPLLSCRELRVLSVSLMKSKLLQSLLVLVFAVQPSPV